MVKKIRENRFSKKVRKGARPRTIPKTEEERQQRIKMMEAIREASKTRIKDIYSYRWLNPWHVLGDFVLIIVIINLILTFLIGPAYGFIAIIIDFILIPLQCVFYWLLAPRWKKENEDKLLEWTRNLILKKIKGRLK